MAADRLAERCAGGRGRRHDEVDIDEERLRRFSQAWKRQAA